MSDQEIRNIKEIRREIGKLVKEEELLKLEVTVTHSRLKKLKQKLHDLKSEAKRIAADIDVSDHAVLRYLERVKGLDIEGIKDEILTPELIALVKACGGSANYTIDGVKVVMKEFIVKTII